MTQSNPACMACRLTGLGKSAVAVIGLRGRDSEAILKSCFQPATPIAFAIGQVRYGQWTGRSTVVSNTRVAPEHNNSVAGDLVAGDSVVEDLVAGESVVVTPRAVDEFEVHCHGGRAAVERILEDLREAGVQVVQEETWDRPTKSPLQREATKMLRRCLTTRTACLAYAQLKESDIRSVPDSVDATTTETTEQNSTDSITMRPGNLSDWVAHHLLTLEKGSSTNPGINTLQAIRSEAGLIARIGRWTIRMDEPFDVYLVGPPNVGKSTLVNALVGYQRSITFDQPGTTRDLLHADTVLDGIPIRLIDTAGLREVVHDHDSNRALNRSQENSSTNQRLKHEAVIGHGQIEQDGIDKVEQALVKADMVLLIEDHLETVDSSWPRRRATLEERLKEHRIPLLWIRSKADLSEDGIIRADENRADEIRIDEGINPIGRSQDAPESAPIADRQRPEDERSAASQAAGTTRSAPIRTAATVGFGISELSRRIVDALTFDMDSGQPIALHERQLAWLVELSNVNSVDRAKDLLAGLRSDEWPPKTVSAAE